MDHLAAMAVFARVVEARGFTAAARDLGLSKSAVSKHVRGLEDHLGARLLNRTTRRLSLTEAGAALYDNCRRMVAEAEAAEAAVAEITAAPVGRLRVNAPLSFGVRHVAPLLAAFLAQHPRLRLDLTLEDRVVDLVDEGYDCAIRVGALPDSTLVARRLAPARVALVAAPGYWRARGKPEKPSDLAGHNCLTYAYRPVSEGWAFGDASVQVRGNLRANNGDALLAAALAGVGAAILPTFIAGADISAGRLETALDADMAQRGGGVFAVMSASRHVPAKVRLFIDFLANSFGPNPYWDRDLQDVAKPT